MLRSTFTCLSGLSESAEKQLWNRGCLCWQHFPIHGQSLFSKSKALVLQQAIHEAERALALGRIDYFLHRLPNAHKARVLPDLAEHIAYLDIETTGLSKSDKLTTATLYQAGELYFFVNGKNLFDLVEQLMQCQLLVTFNGTRFDLPILEKQLGIQTLVPHLDLLPVMKSLGYKGGLKAIEKQLGIPRSNPVNGQDAVQIWQSYQSTGKPILLESLLAYNAEDCINLETILAYAFKQSTSSYPMSLKQPITWKQPVTKEKAAQFISTSTLTSP